MKHLPARRFTRLHEQILLSRMFALIVGWLFSVALPTLLYWGTRAIFQPNAAEKAALITTTLAFLLSHFGVKRLLSSYPGGRSIGLITTQVLAYYAVLVLATLLLRIHASHVLLVASAVTALIWFQFEHMLTRAYFRPKLAVIPGGFADEILDLQDSEARPLPRLDLEGRRYDGVVADFQVITPDQQRFLTACALDNVPVYNAKTVYESLTGRVKIDKMSENNIGSLLPSSGYETLKTLIDWGLVLISLPIVVPICLITAVLIRLESPGPVIYSQTRIGRGNKPFTIYKFRSMRFDRNASEQFAGESDPRITRVGRVIRTLRIDELPQFINVLLGSMSLIGPRPEQPSFVAEFDACIPFYTYRHVVKPGITGWAQVRHGYAADTDQTQVKIEHDFYYIKNCSLALDLYIVFLTIRTMLTGFGSR